MSVFLWRNGLLYFLQLIAEVVTVNLAFNKTTNYCSQKPSLNKMTDGDTNIYNFETFTEPCNTVSYVQVYLGAKYSMHYVVLFEGEENNQGQLDFFLVRLTSVGAGGDHQMCSEYPGMLGTEVSNRGLRVNCARSNNLHSGVIVESRKNIGFSIAEIEVYSFASGFNEKALVHIGCFINFGEKTTQFYLKACQYNCLNNGYTFAGLKEKNLCACSNDIDRKKEMPLHHCPIKCDDGLRFCGGDKGYSVYLITSPLPFYEGCLKTDVEFTGKAIRSGNMTVTECLHLCENRKYALLQNKDHCICSDHITKEDMLPRKQILCSSKCTGDSNMACGAEALASVYSTCKLRAKSSLTCTKLFNCAKSYDMFGSCQGECRQGYVDEHCLEQVDKCVTSNPCLNLSNAYCTTFKGVAMCECAKGYERSKGEECEDFDECEYTPCDDRTSTCQNLNGSFLCNCKSGFISAGDNVCIANTTFNLGLRYYISILKKFLFYTLPVFCVMGFVMLLTCITPRKTDSQTSSSTGMFGLSRRSSVRNRSLEPKPLPMPSLPVQNAGFLWRLWR